MCPGCSWWRWDSSCAFICFCTNEIILILWRKKEAVTLVDGGTHAGRSTLKVTDALALRILVQHDAVTCVHHFARGPQHSGNVGHLDGHADQRPLIRPPGHHPLAVVTDDRSVGRAVMSAFSRRFNGVILKWVFVTQTPVSLL